MYNEILLRRQNKILFDFKWSDTNEDNNAMIGAMIKNINNLGFTFSADLLKAIFSMTKQDIENFYLSLVADLKRYVGANVQFNPMYPNFPKQVMDADDTELFVNAIVHYFTYGTALPAYEKNERLPLLDAVNLKVLSIGTEEDLTDIRNRFLSAKTSLSKQDKEDLVWILKNIKTDLPEEISYKETCAVVSSVLMEEALPNLKQLKKYNKTATDVLRLAAFMSGGDVSLAENTRFKSFSRKERRILLELLDGTNIEDWKKYSKQFIRLGERIHPQEYPRYKRANYCFKKIREGESIKTWYSIVEEKLAEGHLKVACEKLKERPTEFARRLDYLLRVFPEHSEYILGNFERVINKVPLATLLQIREHFKHRSDNEYRVFFAKGQTQKSFICKNELPEIEETAIKVLLTMLYTAICAEITKKKSMGKVWISDDFKGLVAPFSQRSASNTPKPMLRGSRFDIPEDTKVIRPFIWWTNTKEGARTDLDLSVVVFDDDLKRIGICAYLRLRNKAMGLVHSGDIVNGGSYNGSGVSEFVDVDIKKVVEGGGRYVVMSVFCYNGIPYNRQDHAMFGWMNRSADSGEIYEPQTVETKFNLTASSCVAIPAVIDCVERKIIWCDLSATDNSFIFDTRTQSYPIAAACYEMANLHKPMLYDLIRLNANIRGELVDDRNEADLIFDTDTTKPVIRITTVTKTEYSDGTIHEDMNVTEEEKDVKIITPYMTEYFSSELM